MTEAKVISTRLSFIYISQIAFKRAQYFGISVPQRERERKISHRESPVSRGPNEKNSEILLKAAEPPVVPCVLDTAIA